MVRENLNLIFLAVTFSGILGLLIHFVFLGADYSRGYPPCDGSDDCEPPEITSLKGKFSMNQLWQMIRNILGIVSATDVRVIDLGVGQAEIHTKIDTAEGSIAYLTGYTQGRFDQLNTKLDEIRSAQQAQDLNTATLYTAIKEVLEVVQRIQAAVMPLPAVGISFIVGGVEVTQMQMKDNAKLSVSIGAKDALGNPTNLDTNAAPSWAVSDASLASAVASADGLTCEVTPVGPLGSFQVQCSIAAVGDEPALSGALDVEVIASDATEIVLNGAIE